MTTPNPREPQLVELRRLLDHQVAQTLDRETTVSAKAAAMAECDVATEYGAGQWRLSSLAWIEASAGLHMSRLAERSLREQIVEHGGEVS